VAVVADYKVDIPIPLGVMIWREELIWNFHRSAVILHIAFVTVGRGDAECGTLCCPVTSLTPRMNVTVLLGTN